MDTTRLQFLLFKQIRQRVPEQSLLPDMIARVLDISTDSAYRRLRGETMIDLEEATKLCLQFQVSMDSLMGNLDGKIIFTTNKIDDDNFDFSDYLQGIVKNMQYFNSFEGAKMYYECKDIPIFYHFYSREIAAFKYYFWMRFHLQQASFRNRKFSFEEYDDGLYETGRKILHLYNTISSVEYWNAESINSTLRQIRYFFDTGCFTRKADVRAIFEKMLELFNYFEEVVASGVKVPLGEIDPEVEGENFDVYFSEVLTGNNMIVAKLGPSTLTYFNHSGPRYTGTADYEFGKIIMAGLERLTKSSTRLSSINEMERTEFFAGIRERIKDHITKL